MSKLIAVPYAKSKRWECYGTPTGESWSFSGLSLIVFDDATYEVLLAEFDRVLDDEDDEDERFRIGDWIRNPSYRDAVHGFALVKPEIYEMLMDVSTICGRDSEGDAIANFQVAFCVRHAERLVEVAR